MASRYLTYVVVLLVAVLARNERPQPHTGGPQSKKASMLIVDFEQVTEGKKFKEMVEDIQTLLVTGGILTNIFRPKLVIGRGRTERAL